MCLRPGSEYDIPWLWNYLCTPRETCLTHKNTSRYIAKNFKCLELDEILSSWSIFLITLTMSLTILVQKQFLIQPYGEPASIFKVTFKYWYQYHQKTYRLFRKLQWRYHSDLPWWHIARSDKYRHHYCSWHSKEEPNVVSIPLSTAYMTILSNRTSFHVQKNWCACVVFPERFLLKMSLDIERNARRKRKLRQHNIPHDSCWSQSTPRKAGMGYFVCVFSCLPVDAVRLGCPSIKYG